MRWYRAPTYGREQVGVDETRKPVTELRPTGESILVRTAPMRPQESEGAGNRHSYVRRSFMTRAAPDLLDGVEAIEVKGVLYEVEAVTGESPVTAITVRRSKHGLRAG